MISGYRSSNNEFYLNFATFSLFLAFLSNGFHTVRLVTKKENFIMISLLFCILICLASTVTAVIRPSASMYLLDNEGFIAYLDLPKSFGLPINCWFKHRDDEKVKLDLKSTEVIITRRGEAILPFASTVCGVRVSQLSAASAAIWVLEAENAHGEFEQDRVTIQILPAQKTKFSTHIQREVGRGTVSCTKHETYTKHCKIFDNETGESWNRCDAEVIIRPNKTLNCHIFNWGRLEESEEHIFIDIKNATQYAVPRVLDNATSIVLSCQFIDTLHSCQAEMPDHKKELYIMDGLYSGRYSAYDTLISKSKCSLEIPKPLTSAEMGLWKIINYDSSIPSGCMFYVGSSKSEIIENELKRLDEAKVINAYKSVDNSRSEISCSVPFIIDDCYLRDPNQALYFPESYIFDRYRLIGKCVFLNMPIIAGTWKCGARGHDYDKEVLQDIEVIVKPRGGEVLTESIRSKRGNSIELMCKSPFTEPISHCAFIDPQSNVHLVGTTNSIKTAGHVQYYGRGIQTGECGIKINEIRPDDFGQWRCQFIIISGKLSSSFEMTVSESVVGQATSIGLGVGLTVIVVLVFGVVIGTVFYRRRHLSAAHSFPSADPLNLSPSSIATSEA